ncbi:fused MFS/spermidine synthase [Methylicorpusculum oleiharenae]|uniref:fused MFS/spermidine synthase n=1 Tax=Methylicorpusculum oleiharenae TaxID=1338687 RepID=UPI0019D2A44B|nr:fused MFS/spermidine synthase [Methylicorpusculum oleiharenae]MCD2450147.1 fused MFS/spermidine synthase [Methylicorpusculum oleiharenae]
MTKNKSAKSAFAISNQQTCSPGLNKAILFSTVTISGGAVMILELLGTRIIAPFYGVSLYVWSSLITVTMIALAIGYYLGGYCADRFQRLRLSHVAMIAAFATVIIPFISGPVLTMTNPLGLRAGAFVSSFILFGTPLTALAMFGPFVIKMATRDLKGVGTAAGSVYAVSTVGSVLGTVLLGFYLLPQFGSRTIVFSLSLVLLMLAAFWVVLDNRQKKQSSGSILPLAIIAVISVVMATNGFAKSEGKTSGFNMLHEEESIYGWVRVVEDVNKGYRMLLSDASVLSAVDKRSGHSLLSYQWVLGGLQQFRPKAEQALLIGLGGGHVAKELKSKGVTTDTIEIDSAVAQASLDYFNFKPTGDFIVGDARYEIRQLHKRYDFIIHDCFTGGSEPTHLLTQEMLTQLRGLLTKSGILALNYVGFTKGEGSDAVQSVYKTLQTVLPNIRVFITDKEEFTDFIFLASAEPLLLDRNSSEFRVSWLLDHEYHFKDSPTAIVFTDDYNPVESMQLRKAENYREVFIQRVAPELLQIL